VKSAITSSAVSHNARTVVKIINHAIVTSHATIIRLHAKIIRRLHVLGILAANHVLNTTVAAVVRVEVITVAAAALA
jgi:hypothetical protein